jgi:hypothetical protein
MKIKSMSATFGKLENAHLELGSGLNLIHAPNEGGKSTWAAFWKAMLYGIDTRDRDKKGHLADKNRYQPWSGAPMQGEVTLELQGREITIRRSQKGSVPFGAFSAVYTDTDEPVPGLTASNCGVLLTGVDRDVFERSAFIGSGGDLAVTAAPELEKRIAALVSSGEEDISYSQVEATLREWLNRRKVNRSVGLIPKLEGELSQTREALTALGAAAEEIARLEADRSRLESQKRQLTDEAEIHRRLAQQELNRRFTEAEEEFVKAQNQLATLEREQARFGVLPPREELKRAQGDLQYIKALDEEIKQADGALKEADEAYVQAQIDAQDDLFTGMSGDEATSKAAETLKACEEGQNRAKRAGVRGWVTAIFGGVLALSSLVDWLVPALPSPPAPVIWGLLALAAALIVSSFYFHRQKTREEKQAAALLVRYNVQQPDDLTALAQNYAARYNTAQQAADHAKTVRGALNDRKARRENCRSDLLDFVHTFAPEVRDLFGCSAALSRALNLDHDLSLVQERVEERRRRRDDLAAQGGQLAQTMELLHKPDRTVQETYRLLTAATLRLEQVNESLNQALGRQKAMGDPAALSAQREELERELVRRQQEYDALTLALESLHQANLLLQERFSPALNHLAGNYLAQLTKARYSSVSFNRALEGAAARAEDVLPRSALYLSRGTADQLYLALRLAVCGLCLPEKPPILLDDALTAFDDTRLISALKLLGELAQEQQILLFTCQNREAAAFIGNEQVKVVEL